MVLIKIKLKKHFSIFSQLMKKTLFGIHGNCRKILKVLSQFVKLS